MSRRASWKRRVEVNGERMSEEELLLRLLKDAPPQGLYGMATDIQPQLPPLPNGKSRTVESIRHKISRLLPNLDDSPVSCSSPQSAASEPEEQSPPPPYVPKHALPLVEQLADPTVSLDRWFEIFEELQTLLDESDPFITTQDITIDTDTPIAIGFESDSHLGGRFTAHKIIRDEIQRLKETPGYYWGLHGDDIEGFLPKFRSGQAILQQLIPPQQQRQILAAIVKILAEAGKLLYAIKGEHGGVFYESAIGENPVKEVYLNNKVPYFDGKGIVKLYVGEVLYILGVAHKFPGTSIYNPNHPQARALRYDFPNADLIISGHTHSPALQQVPAYVTEYDAGLRSDPHVWLVQAGTAKTGPDPYSIRGWRRGIFGWPIFMFHPHQHAVRLVQDKEDLEYFLREKKWDF